MIGPVHFLTAGYIKLQISLEMNRSKLMEEVVGVENIAFVTDKFGAAIDGNNVIRRRRDSVTSNDINDEASKRYKNNIRDMVMNATNIFNSNLEKMKTNTEENKNHIIRMNNNHYVVLDLSHVTFLDEVGAIMVKEVNEYVKKSGGRLAISGIEHRFAEVLDKSGVLSSMSVCIYPTYMDAINMITCSALDQRLACDTNL